MAKARRKHFWKRELLTVAIGLAVVATITYFDFNGRLEAVELSTSDHFVYGPGRYPNPTGAVVIARIDDKSVAELGRWPWGRDVEARMVRALTDIRYGWSVST